MRVLVVFALVGCQGEPVAAASTDASTDSQSAITDTQSAIDAGDATSASDAGPCSRAGDLVRNGSFEEGGGTSTASWTDGHFMRREGGADTCAHWAEMKDVPAWRTISEAIFLEAPAGATFDYGFSFRAGDATVGGIAYFLNGTGDDSRKESPSLTSSWQRVENTLTLTKPSSKLVIGFNTNSPDVRTFGVDSVWVVRTK